MVDEGPKPCAFYGDSLMERLLALQASFQDYMVPVVTIKETNISRILAIFEKINSTGTPLDPVDFMRAITWAEDFDLSHALERVNDRLTQENFSLPDETTLKCVGLVLGMGQHCRGHLHRIGPRRSLVRRSGPAGRPIATSASGRGSRYVDSKWPTRHPRACHRIRKDFHRLVRHAG